MKRRIFLLAVILALSNLLEVNATPLSSYLPGGKNYLEEANMIFTTNMMQSNDDFLVKPSTEYTLSIPGTTYIGTDVYIEVSGNISYLAGEPSDIAGCLVNTSDIICTFTTTAGEDYLSLMISADRLSMYFDYDQFYGFQLEEGPMKTTYEEYIAPLMDVTDPEFSGSGAYITSYETNESIQSIVSNHIVAIDDLDGNISNNIIIVTDDYTTNEQTVGEYDVLLSVSDASGNEALFTLTIMVKDEISPVIYGPANVDISVGSNDVLLNIINSVFVVFEEYDDSTSINVLLDEYTINKETLGVYNITFTATDSSSNSSERSFTISVVDTEIPVMIGDNIYNSYLSNPLDFDGILNSLSFSDNYTDLLHINPTITLDTFSGYEYIPGTYTINLEIEDSSHNVLSESLTINVIDDVEPTISGITTYSSSYTETLTIDDFLNMLSVSDNVGGLLDTDLYIISDNYSTRDSEIGDYIIVFGIMDFNNNETTHTININIFDDIPPIIYVDNYIVTVNLSATFDEADALKLLLNSNELVDRKYSVVKLIDEYTGNEKNPGTYIYRLSFIDEEGVVYEKEFLVKVVDSSSLDIGNSDFIRNIVIYSSIMVFIVYLVIKKRKRVLTNIHN